jgi:hypothetical protein
MRGYDFKVNTVVLARGDDRSLRLSARAKIADAKAGADGQLTATLSQVAGVPFGVLVCGLDAEPQRVVLDGKAVAKREALTRDASGWQYLPDRKWLVVNLTGTGRQAELAIEPIR